MKILPYYLVLHYIIYSNHIVSDSTLKYGSKYRDMLQTCLPLPYHPRVNRLTSAFPQATNHRPDLSPRDSP